MKLHPDERRIRNLIDNAGCTEVAVGIQSGNASGAVAISKRTARQLLKADPEGWLARVFEGGALVELIARDEGRGAVEHIPGKMWREVGSVKPGQISFDLVED